MNDAFKNHFEKGWYEILKPYFQTNHFKDIGKQLIEISKQQRVVPEFKDTFRAFRECSWSNLNTVILGMDPYPGINPNGSCVADGLAFSARYSTKCPKSLDYIYKAIDYDIYKNESTVLGNTLDLSYLANQGILLLNCALTFPIGGKAGDHIELWRPFIAHVLKIINEKKSMMAYILMGKPARQYKNILDDETAFIVECEHPARAVYNEKGIWNHNNVFDQVNNFHKTFNNIKINW